MNIKVNTTMRLIQCRLHLLFLLGIAVVVTGVPNNAFGDDTAKLQHLPLTVETALPQVSLIEKLIAKGLPKHAVKLGVRDSTVDIGFDSLIKGKVTISCCIASSPDAIKNRAISPGATGCASESDVDNKFIL